MVNVYDGRNLLNPWEFRPFLTLAADHYPFIKAANPDCVIKGLYHVAVRPVPAKALPNCR